VPCFKAGKGTRTLDIECKKLLIIALFQVFKDALFVTNSHGVGSSQSKYALHFKDPNPQQNTMHFKVDSPHNAEAKQLTIS
jgi:hypothetical protein